MNSAEANLRRILIEIIARKPEGITFDALRDELESEEGIYIDGVKLRKIVAEMIREGIVCKEPSSELKKMLMKICKQTG